jgi:hypothetical protein
MLDEPSALLSASVNAALARIDTFGARGRGGTKRPHDRRRALPGNAAWHEVTLKDIIDTEGCRATNGANFPVEVASRLQTWFESVDRFSMRRREARVWPIRRAPTGGCVALNRKGDR